jgi:hypothetical protein
MVLNSLFIIIIWKFIFLIILKCNTRRHETVLSFYRNKNLVKLLGNHWTMRNNFIRTLWKIIISLDNLQNQRLGWIRLNYLVISIYLLVLEALNVIWQGFSLCETELLLKSIWYAWAAYNNLGHALDLS